MLHALLKRTPRGVAALARGCLVLLAGPDGSGKTTMSDALESCATSIGVRISRAHYRPGVFGGRPPGSMATEAPHEQRQRGLLAGALKLLVLAADMTVGYLLRWRGLRTHGVLIVERGWWDMAVDPRRYRLDARLVPLVRLLGLVIPRADVVVLLGGDPVAIDARKHEIGVAEVERQLSSWERYAGRAGRCVVRVDTVVEDRYRVAGRVLGSAPGIGPEPPYPVRRVPLTPKRLTLTSAGQSRPAGRLYEPFHPVRKAVKPIGLAAARYGLARRADEPFDVRQLCRDLDLDCTGYVTQRSSYPGRWLIGVCSDDELTTVIKVATGHDRPLQKEIATLLRLQLAPPRSFDVPRVRWSGTWGDMAVLAVDALPPAPAATRVDDVIALCNSMVNGERGMPPVVHGDLAPWNVRLSAGRPVVIDWESAYLARAPLRDLSHFVISSGALLAAYTPRQAVAMLCGEGSPGARHLCAVGEDPHAAVTFLRNYLTTTPSTSRRIAEFRAGVEGYLAAGGAR